MNRLLLIAIPAATLFFLGLLIGRSTPSGGAGEAMAEAWSEPAALTAAASQSFEYQVDNVHSSVFFKIRHLGVSNFYGRFNQVGGSYTFDPESPDSCRFDVQIQTESVDTNSDGRNGHLKSPDFFNAKEFPSITFKSTDVTRKSDEEFEVSGDLTFHGVTKPISAKLEWIGARDTGPRFGPRSGCEARFVIKRSDYGMDKYVAEGVLGDEVEIIVSLEGTLQD